MSDQIESFADDIEEIVQLEALERETRLADLLSKKSDNLEKNRKDIKTRPEKQWIMSNKDKQKLKTEENDRVKQIDSVGILEVGGLNGKPVTSGESKGKGKGKGKVKESNHETAFEKRQKKKIKEQVTDKK